MSEPAEKGVLIEVSAGEFIDRHLINSLRIKKLKTPADLPWIKEQTAQAALLLQKLAAHSDLIERLEEIHAILWDLEDQVRSAPGADLASLARQIFAMNDERHTIKSAIDQALPTRCAAGRIYSNQAR